MVDTLREIAKDFEKKIRMSCESGKRPNAGEVLKRAFWLRYPRCCQYLSQSIELQEWAKAGYFEDLSNKDYLKRVKNHYA